MLENNNNIKIPSTIINKNSDIELMNKYLKDKNLDDFNNIELLILFKIFDYLGIQDKEIMSSLFEKIFENIKDFNEEELIKLFHFKRINNSKSSIKNNKNKNKNCKRLCKNKNSISTIIENNNGAKCQCSISG